MKADKNAYIPDEEEVLSELRKGERRARGFAVSSTIIGRGTRTANFKTEVDAREYMKELRDSSGKKLVKCKLLPLY
jgi:hypothetical protein